MMSSNESLWVTPSIGSVFGRVLAVVALVMIGGGGVCTAADSDLSTSMSGPPGAVPGDTAVITFGYSNAGPDTAGSAYANAYIPSGVPAPIDMLTQLQIDALEASATADALGNFPLLFVDDFQCEHLLFQVQEDDGDLVADPIIGLDPGVTGTVTFGLEIPMDPPKIGGVIIDQPPALAGEFKGAVAGEHILNAAGWNRYSRGADCDDVPDCADLTACFGPRVSLTDPIVEEFELVDDGSLDPTFGCEALIGFTPGRIAVVERGGCEFGVKAVNAETAGAQAVFVVNNDQCSTFPASDLCVINMGGGVVGDQVTIPIVMVSLADGGPVVTELTGGGTVTGQLGAVSDVLTLDGTIFLADVADTDPVATNNENAFDLVFGGLVFADGFETGDASGWSSFTP